MSDSRTNSMAAYLRAALDVIARRVPAARTALLETSDQNSGYGFILLALYDANGETINLPQDEALSLDDELDKYLSDLDWDSVVGEDRHGYAVHEVANPGAAQ